jgi:DAACS family dicarboxylate/amino acid:cation (Na+ or H+) symporter
VLDRLALRMLIGLAAGAALGVAAHALAADSAWLDRLVRWGTAPAGQIFLRLLFMLVIPLLVSALALGIAGLGDLRRLGRIGLRTLAYTAAVSAIAVVIGIALVNALRPGDGLPAELRERLVSGAPPAPAPTPSGVDLLVELVPSNPVRAMADGDMLAVMLFALLLGVGLSAVRTPAARALEEGLQGLFEVSMWLLQLVLRAAPLGVACLVFTLTARAGLEIFAQLGSYVLVVLGGLALHMFGVYSLLVLGLGRMSPLHFFRGIRAAALTAFATASSNATLPTALLVADRELALPSHVSRFVLTLGSTANQNGTALFEGVTVLFLAQLFGVELDLGRQVLVVAICILGGIGTAGVPAGSLPVVAMILAMVGVPAEGIGLVLGVDRFLDMCRTCVNVTGDLAIAVVVSRAEGSVTQPT